MLVSYTQNTHLCAVKAFNRQHNWRFANSFALKTLKAAIIENAPQMLELLRDIATPKRGSDAEMWSIEHAAQAAAKLIAKINSTTIA